MSDRDTTTDPPHPPGPLRIGLLLMPQFEFSRGVLRGIAAWVAEHRGWSTSLYPFSAATAAGVAAQGFAGVIVQLFDGEAAPRCVRDLGVPAVNVSTPTGREGLPRVSIDDAAVGRLAAHHFRDRGFRHFGFYGIAGHAYSDRKLLGMREVLGADSVAAFTQWQEGEAPALRERRLGDWLAGLPRPVGVLGAYDYPALVLARLCAERGLRVPEDVAILGSDNDEAVCSAALPPLSSVALPLARVGYEAAALLDRLLRGQAPPERDLELPPLGVVTRQSSDLLAIEDPDLVAALRHIHAHCAGRLRVEDLLRVVPTNRRTLERRFRDRLGRSPLAEIRRVRIERAKDLLTRTDLPISAVATRSGFASAWRLATVFRQVTGQTPMQYRSASTVRGGQSGGVAR